MNNYKIDKTKNIGNVIFVVEGGRKDTGGTELRLLKKIFADILEYEVQELRRDSEEFIAHGNNNPNCKVFALNVEKNQLTQLSEEAMDTLFVRLREEFKIKPEDCPIFFLYDRDVKSYHNNELRAKYVRKYVDPYGTDEGDQGQLLLSYPSVESFMLSCIMEESYKLEGKMGGDAKNILKNKLLGKRDTNSNDDTLNNVESIFSKDTSEAEKQLIHSVIEMNKGLEMMGISDYDLDNLAPTLLGVYDYEQDKLNAEDTLTFLSLIEMALLELGVIEKS